MFDCKTCKILAEQNEFLREQVKTLTDKVLALANPQALALARYEPENSSQFYGSSDEDVLMAYDEFGQQTVVEKKQ